MAKINLLPWRDELRKQQLQEFSGILGMVVVAAIVVSFGWKQAREQAVETQQARNTYVEAQIVQLEQSIKELDELQRRRNSLVERTNVIQGLQGNRPMIVHVFDQFAETLQDGVFYTSITQVGTGFDITGIAESNNRVSNLMRSVDASPWLKNPQLNRISARGEMFEFSLSVQLEDGFAAAAAAAMTGAAVDNKGLPP